MTAIVLAAKGSFFRGLATRLASTQFLLELAAMHDALFELTELSCVLQDRSTTIDKADRTIRRTIFRFEVMKDKPGTQILKAMLSIKNMQHGSVPLSTNARYVQFNYKQFLTSLMVNMGARLISTEKGGTTVRFLDEIKILDSSNWPEMPPQRYGRDELASQCQRFSLEPPAVLVLNDFSDYMENLGRGRMPHFFTLPKKLYRFDPVQHGRM